MPIAASCQQASSRHARSQMMPALPLPWLQAAAALLCAPARPAAVPVDGNSDYRPDEWARAGPWLQGAVSSRGFRRPSAAGVCLTHGAGVAARVQGEAAVLKPAWQGSSMMGVLKWNGLRVHAQLCCMLLLARVLFMGDGCVRSSVQAPASPFLCGGSCASGCGPPTVNTWDI